VIDCPGFLTLVAAQRHHIAELDEALARARARISILEAQGR
jgi:hypothetical protein